MTCFEVIEHVAHGQQVAWFAGLRRHLSAAGTLLLSTELLGAAEPVQHYYIAPRNGHISLFSGKSLAWLGKRYGLRFASSPRHMHAYFVSVPDWAQSAFA